MDAAALIAIRTGLDTDVVRRSLEGKRSWNAPLELEARDAENRAADADGDKPTPGMRISGYSAVFDSDSERLFGFLREQIKRGAFRKSLKRNPDVRLLINHEGAPYARTTNDTLTLSEDVRGLHMTATLDDRRQDARDLYHATQRGDFDQQSFAFTIAADEWRYCDCVEADDYAGCDCEWQRDILEIGDLYEVSVVTFPAYPDTTVSVARNSEPTVEQAAQACDDEQRDQATDADTSTSESAGDPNHLAMRTRIARLGRTRNVRRNQRGA